MIVMGKKEKQIEISKIQKNKEKVVCFNQQNLEEKEYKKIIKDNEVFIKKGRKEKKVYTVKPKYYEKEGNFKIIQLDLIDNQDCYENKTNSFKTKFIKKPANNDFVEINDGELILKYNFENKEPLIQTKDNSIIYKEVSPGVDLEYQLTEDKVKENLVIKQKKEKYEFDCQITLKKCEVKYENERLLIYKNGNLRYEILSPYMIDKKGTMSSECYYEVEKTEDGLQVKVIADAQWINHEERVFPIKIDPTIIVYNSKNAPISYKFFNSLTTSSTIDRFIGYVDNIAYYLTITLHNELIKEIDLNTIDKILFKIPYEWAAGSPSQISFSTTGQEEYVNITFDENQTIKEIDLTTQLLAFLKNETTKNNDFILQFMNSKNEFHVLNIGINDIELETVYDNKRIYKVGEYEREYDLKRAGVTSWNVLRNNIKHKHYDTTIKSNSLSVDLYHIYDDSINTGEQIFLPLNEQTQEYKCGLKWKTNLHQNLFKLKLYNDDREGYIITYIDGSGIHHELIEKWYYKKDESKIYIKKEEAKFDSDGKLKYEDSQGEKYEVKYETSNDEGLNYLSVSSMYNYDEFINFTKQERYYALFANGVKKYLYIDNQDNVYIPQFVWYKTIDDYYLLTPLNINVDEKNRFIVASGAEQVFVEYFLLKVPKSNIETYSQYVFKEYTHLDNVLYNDVSYFVNEDIQSANEKIESLKSNITSLNQSKEELESNIKELYGSCEDDDFLYSGSDDSSKKQKMISKTNKLKQYDIYVEKLLSINDQINCYRDVLAKLEKQKLTLVQQQLQSVNEMIIDKENNILGFDGYGKLVLIQDKDENKITIEYGIDEEVDRILKVKGDSEEITFTYNQQGRLKSIIDVQGRTLSYEYDSTGKLIKIIYPDDKMTIINYSENNLSSIEDQTGLLITYTNGIKISTKVETISEDNQKLLASEKVLVHDCVSGGMERFCKLGTKDGKNPGIYFNENKQVIAYQETQFIFKEYYKNNYLYNVTIMLSGILTSTSEFNFDKTYTFVDTITDEETQILKNDLSLSRLLCMSAFIPYISDSNINMKVVLTYEDESIVTYTKDTKVFTQCYVNMPFYLEKNIKSMRIVLESNMDLSNTGYKPSFSISRCTGSIYTYDEEDRIIKEENALSSTSYLSFDENDNPTQIVIEEEFETIITKLFYNSNNQLIHQQDDKGDCIDYEYDENKKLTKIRKYNIEDESLNKIFDNKALNDYNYISYGFLNENQACVYKEINGYLNKTTFKYNYGLLTKLIHPGMKINYEYDGFGRVTKVIINDVTQQTIVYTDNYTDDTYGYYVSKVETTLANGIVKTEYYDNQGRILAYNDGNDNIKYSYDQQKRIISKGNDSSNYIYEYNKAGLIAIKKYFVGGLEICEETYNYTNKKLSEYQVIFDCETTSCLPDLITYDSNNRMSRYTNRTINYAIDYQYDSLNRVVEESYNSSQSFKPKVRYEYLQQEENTTNLIKEQTYFINDNELIENVYEYDDKNNIKKISINDEEIRYTYDENNRLVREDNQKLNETIVYLYDTSGNIVKRKKYDYTLEDKLGEIKTKDVYRYSLTGWKDRLVSYNNKVIEYDNMGYPTKYKDEEMCWKKGRLKSYKGVSNIYDFNGIRTSKTVNGVTTRYYIIDSRIHKIVDSLGNTMVIYYTIDKMTGFSYNGNVYYYVRNIQGDITHIYKSDNTLVCEYVYDGYGNHKVKDSNGEENTSDTFIGNINPFRYRGYYYDVETQLYWVSSRYYSPELCRWISPDSIEYLDPQSINGLNLYAYCGNDPVNKYDPTGHFPWLILAAFLFVGVTRAAANAIGQYQSTGQIDWFEVAVEGVYGGVMGALTVVTAGTFSIAKLAIRAGVTAVAMGLKDGLLMYNDTGDVDKAGMAALQGALKGGLIGFTSYVAFSPTNVTQWTFASGASIGIGFGYLSGLKDKNQEIQWPWMWEAVSY